MAVAAAELFTRFPPMAVPFGKGTSSNKQSQTQIYFGHCYSVAADSINTVTKIVGNTDSFHSLIKFFVSVSEAVSPARYIDKFATSVVQVDTWIDGVRIFHDIRKLSTLECVNTLKKGRFAEFCSDMSFIVADTSATVCLAGFLNIVKLGATASTFGSVALFGQGLAFAFVGLQCGLDAKNGDTSERNMVWLGCSVAEVVHKLFLAIVGAAALGTTGGVVTAGLLGMVANGIGVYAEYHYPESYH